MHKGMQVRCGTVFWIVKEVYHCTVGCMLTTKQQMIEIIGTDDGFNAT